MSFNNIIDRASKAGKIDKQIQSWRERRDMAYVSMIPRTDLEKNIKDINNRINALVEERKLIGVNECLHDYLQSRVNRHDVWIQFIDKCKAVANQSVGDVSLRAFRAFMKDVYDIELTEPPRNKKGNYDTPDILLYMPRTGCVYLGDVAVTNSVALANSTKYQKYKYIADWIRENELPIIHKNVIIASDLSNIRQVVRMLSNDNVIEELKDILTRACEYHKTCNNDMNRIFTRCKDQSELRKAIDRNDNILEVKLDVELDDFDIEMKIENPTIDEEEIIRWVKDETEDRLNNYYDKDINATIQSYDRLIEGHRSKPTMEPKSTLMVCDNSYEFERYTSHKLAEQYIEDILMGPNGDIRDYLLNILPSKRQLKEMEEIYNTNRKSKNINMKVYGPYQYLRTQTSSNLQTMTLNNNLLKGKKIRNDKKEPRTIDVDTYGDCVNLIEKGIRSFGERSNKQPFLDDSWEAATAMEHENTSLAKEIYDYSRSTVGAQLAHSLSSLFYRLSHLKTAHSIRDNIYIPPNGGYIAIIPKEHAPFTSKNCDVPAIFITRFTKTSNDKASCDYEYYYETEEYCYYISKLCRFNMNKIANWDQAGYKLVATSTYIMARCPELYKERERTVGILTYLILDIHQKTSEFLDLFKYIAYMPFSQVHRLSSLIEDKLNLLIKTKLDVWMLLSIKEFIIRLSMTEKLNALKPKIHIIDGKVAKESLGMAMSLPSFISPALRHNNIPSYIEEINALNIIRPKHLYGSQFMDKSIDSTVGWNIEYEEEVEKYKNWLTTGEQVEGIPYPFNAKFAFCKDAILYAQQHYRTVTDVDIGKVKRKMMKEKYFDYMHYNCSLRGCTKEPEDRRNNADLHTTSMDACLNKYRLSKFEDSKCTSYSIAKEFLNSEKIMEFSMSEKDQRGGGRPIATPTLGTKAALMLIEKPEAAIGAAMPNNIIVRGKNKLQEQSEKYKQLLADGSTMGLKQIYQLTEDQSKFSENDNTRKYIPYISNNHYLDVRVRKYQLAALDKLIGREHLVHRLPTRVMEDKVKATYINKTRNGVIANIGWPQGMLNFISTTMHAMADTWITKAYNQSYPGSIVHTTGLVHSDDSWVAVACNSLEDFKRFSLFRAIAKKLFCLKLNEKKLWGSKYLGELVSNYNINGNVHLSVVKTVANSFSGLMYQNWVIDVHSQVSNLQQAYRNGADISTLILMWTIFKQQICTSYQVKGYQDELRNLLPIELGGYPRNSVFELAISGLSAHYNELYRECLENPTEDFSLIIRKAVTLSVMHNNGKKLGANFRFFNRDSDQKKYVIDKEREFNYNDVEEKQDDEVTGNIDRGELDDEWSDEGTSSDDEVKVLPKQKKKDNKDNNKILEEDYDSVSVAGRGDIFTAIKHLMPKSNKITLTVNNIRNLPFVPTGIEMVVPRPIKLADSLGNLKEQTNTMLYQLAAEHYTQSVRRMAVSQAIQSSGKTIRIGDLSPMTVNEMLKFLLIVDIHPTSMENLKASLVDDTPLSELCFLSVYSSTFTPTNEDKRRIINKMPEMSKEFTTICQLKNVLLKIIDDKCETKYYDTYTNREDDPDVLKDDCNHIKRRFNSYFMFYQTKYACNLIMQQSIMSRVSKLWMQPHIRNDSIDNFISDLYGKTVNPTLNYNVIVSYRDALPDSYHTQAVNTMYSAEVLNTVYPGKFKIQTIEGMYPEELIRAIEYENLTPNDYAKWVCLYYKYTGNPEVVRDYEDHKEYDQFYIIPQIYKKGRYTGKFVCAVKYCGTILKFSGEPGDMIIESSTTNIVEITKAMQRFTSDNFMAYKYDHPSLWASTDMWVGKNIITGRQYLTYYSANVTHITRDRGMMSVPFHHNPSLRYPIEMTKSPLSTYEFDESFRCIYKVDEGGRKIRVLNVQQSLESPLAAKCTLEPEYINGIDNNMLFRTGAIVNIAMRKYNNTSRKVYEELLRNSLGGVKKSVYGCFIENIICSTMKDKEPISIEDQDYDLITYEVDPVAPGQFVIDHATTDPEDLEAVQVDAIYEGEDRVASITIHGNLNRLIARLYVGYQTKDTISYFLHQIYRDMDVRKKLVEIKKKDEKGFEDEIEAIKEASEYCDPSLKLGLFIMGNDLDNYSSFSKFDIKELIKARYYPLKGIFDHDLVVESVSLVKELLDIDEVPESWEELIDE